ncbi:MAG: hypothetical protein AAGF67_04010 [Verrucomicrobiota bacterium]
MKAIQSMRFLAITLLTAAGLTPVLAQESEKSDAKLEKTNVFKQEGGALRERSTNPPEISILVEYISLDAGMAANLLAKYSVKPNEVGDLREKLDTMIEEGAAKLEETMWVRAKSGKRCLSASYLFDIYPSEFDSPEIPSHIGTTDSEGGTHMTSAMPTAFECRDVGTSLEVDPVLSGDQRQIDLNLTPEIVKRIGENYYTLDGYEKESPGMEHVATPLMYTIKDTLSMRVTPGQYAILGIHKPHDDTERRILALLRADLISFD